MTPQGRRGWLTRGLMFRVGTGRVLRGLERWPSHQQQLVQGPAGEQVVLGVLVAVLCQQPLPRRPCLLPLHPLCHSSSPLLAQQQQQEQQHNLEAVVAVVVQTQAQGTGLRPRCTCVLCPTMCWMLTRPHPVTMPQLRAHTMRARLARPLCLAACWVVPLLRC